MAVNFAVMLMPFEVDSIQSQAIRFSTASGAQVLFMNSVTPRLAQDEEALPPVIAPCRGGGGAQ